MENWNMPQPLWGVGLLFYLCYVLSSRQRLHGLQIWLISDLSQIWVYGFRGLRRCQWRGGPKSNLWMSGDRNFSISFRLSKSFICRNYFIFFKLSKLFKCMLTKRQRCHTYVFWLRWVKSIKLSNSQPWYSKDEKPIAVSWLKVRKDWKKRNTQMGRIFDKDGLNCIEPPATTPTPRLVSTLSW